MTEYRFSHLVVTKNDGVLDVVLDRPEVRNAINRAMDTEFNRCLDLAAGDREVRAVMIRGNGPVFSAGHDLKESDTSWHSAWERELERSWYFYKPLIAGVHGYVGPAANAWLASCDFIIAAAGTRFSLESIRGSGTAALRGAYALWMTQLPMRVVYKLNLMGGWYTAEQALDWQCVQRVVALEQLARETRRWAATCARVRTSGYATAKRKLHAYYERRAALGDQMAPPEDLAECVFETPAGSPTSFERDAVARGLSVALKDRAALFDPDVIRV